MNSLRFWVGLMGAASLAQAMDIQVIPINFNPPQRARAEARSWWQPHPAELVTVSLGTEDYGSVDRAARGAVWRLLGSRRLATSGFQFVTDAAMLARVT